MKRKWFFGIEFKKEDFWIGVFWKFSERRSIWGYKRLDIWVCVLPMLPLHFGYQIRPDMKRRKRVIIP